MYSIFSTKNNIFTHFVQIERHRSEIHYSDFKPNSHDDFNGFLIIFVIFTCVMSSSIYDEKKLFTVMINPHC